LLTFTLIPMEWRFLAQPVTFQTNILTAYI